MDGQVFIGDNRPEDVRWLCSLSESELDLLISLKKLALQRAKVVGHESLAKIFDLRMLRALGYILMQHVNGNLNTLQMPGLDRSEDLLDGCNLLKLDLEGSNRCSEKEKLPTQGEMDKKKRKETGRTLTSGTFSVSLATSSGTSTSNTLQLTLPYCRL